MNSKLQRLIKAFHRRLDKVVKSWEPPVEEKAPLQPFHSLSPIKDAEVTQYVTALQWALDNRDKACIHNIALTGPYGSGKSSILQTFKDQNKDEAFVFLEISLATFKEEPAKGDKKKPEPTGGKKQEDLVRLIEFSILQQIFYHEEDRKIPDSRFKKIRSFNRKERLWTTAVILLSLLFGFNLFFPEQVEAMLEAAFPHWLSLLLHWISLVVFLVSVSMLTFRSIRLIFGIRINKFKIKEAEIEIDEGISKSILNNHLDEILYFFEVTGYSVVLIEDLDRFRQAEIFTKLRELNLLINNSKKVKQTVVFIYAVRDEMFQDKDRTKFFDFIIPVIPVINSSNSNDKLAKIVADNKYPLSTQLIDDVALFIDDMRLLYNITNEYHLYRELLDKALPQDKLFAMIVYKNIYPDDFVLLHDGDGILYKLLTSKMKYNNELVAGIDAKIGVLNTEIRQMENLQIRDAVELRMLYLSYYVSEVSGFTNFTIVGVDKEIKEVAADEHLFDYFIEDKVECNQVLQWQTNLGKKKIKFATIQSQADPDHTYMERLRMIKGFWDDKGELIKKRLQELEMQKGGVRHRKLQELLSDTTVSFDIDTGTKQGLLLKLLLRFGYIDENYLDYISLFYPGSLTKTDRAFLLDVKSEVASAYDFSLQKIANLAAKIRPVDFQQAYSLNYDLMDFLLVNEGCEEQLSYMLGQLNDQTSYGPGFADGFITNGTNVEVFIQRLAHKWPGIWKYVSENSPLTAERKDTYFKLLIANARTDDLKKIATDSSLVSRMTLHPGFLTIIPDEGRLKKLIKAFNLKFEHLDLKKAPKSLADFVYKGDYYAITPAMLEGVMQFAGKFNAATFETSNYQAVLDAECPELARYINSSINEYVQDVYLTLPVNNQEPELALLALLNHTDLRLKNRIGIIRKVETCVSDLAGVTGTGMDEVLFECSRVLPTWHNLIAYYTRFDKGIDDSMISFLNMEANAEALAEQTIETDADGQDPAVAEQFLMALLNETGIEDSSYTLLLKAVPYMYDIDVFAEVGEDKMALLIAGNMLDSTPANLARLKSAYPDLAPAFLDKLRAVFIANIEGFSPDAADVAAVLKSKVFSMAEKNKVIQSVSDELLTRSREVLRELMRLIFTDPSFKVAKNLLIAALQQPFPVQERVKLFNMHYKIFAKEDILKIFGTFPYPYGDIGVLHKSPVVDHEQENRYLATNLKERHFISNVSEEKKGIRIINFKKEK